MLRCIQIAKNGLGNVAPNPMVGCVIAYNDTIIGEGYTSPYGGNHAEVNAINSVIDKSLLAKASLYVTLEPCSHHGKTPPCTDLLTHYKIPKVFIGTQDRNKLVNGQGINKLKEAGCEVKVGILEKECRDHHKRFFTFHEKKRPYVILKWAQSSEGFIAPEFKDEQAPVWISNKYSRQLTHKWRAEEQAILVGTNTVVDDNPTLTTRDWEGKNPIRVVLDRNGRLDYTSSIFNEGATTMVISQELKQKSFAEKSNFEFETIDWEKNIPLQILEILYKKGINSIIVEGGKQTLETFIEENLWDEARIFSGIISLGLGISAPRIIGKTELQKNILTDALTLLINDQNPDI
ncbi:diaminohydroxyphosphoribosylaminopyrimidine deaminase [Flavobacteriaceae bacterium MAR_2010_188]|nr:diaminohydroxyphosphoribosylaminopyrimidine deaminase [Flavobacteriaceae bacterium MAR_2010_188]